ncbi:hypothetical protein EHS25_003594 [Saitozyma podzolica]|uniref:Uncharacterized protein n=1 Tax=Saitozyma podzolica TaxID=1890683 RepID=A0A427Y7M8_9TREE|nr:hypothetical protein EHS25_003594 [Saitozyma podzolica]
MFRLYSPRTTGTTTRHPPEHYANATSSPMGSWPDVAGVSEYNNTSLSFAETVVTLPGYAFATWNGSKWDAAQASASPTETVAPIVASTTLSRSFPQFSGTLTTSPSNPSTTSSSTSSASPSDDASSSSSDAVTRWGPVVGGIAGGMLAIFALGLLWRWYRRRRTPDRWAQSATSGVRDKGSFLDMITDRPSSKDGRRDTEDLADPETFAAPRPAPKPSGLRYTTTSERLQARQDSADSISFYNGEGEDEPLPPPRVLVGHGESEAVHSFGPTLSPSTDSFMDENGSPKAPPQAYLASHLAPSPRARLDPLPYPSPTLTPSTSPQQHPQSDELPASLKQGRYLPCTSRRRAHNDIRTYRKNPSLQNRGIP